VSESIELFARAVAGFGRQVHTVGDAQWSDPTPCTDWDVRMLIQHVTVEQLWAPPLLGGLTVAEVGDRFDGDVLGADPVGAWDAAAARSCESFAAAVDGAMVELSRGTTPLAEYLWEMTTDALIHSWDLARGIGGDETLDAELVEVVYERTEPVAAHLHETGLFAPPVPVAADAPLPVRLLALFGRSG
jgi:uncharacterized protein (TIGR03086 family)